MLTWLIFQGSIRLWFPYFSFLWRSRVETGSPTGWADSHGREPREIWSRYIVVRHNISHAHLDGERVLGIMRGGYLWRLLAGD